MNERLEMDALQADGRDREKKEFVYPKSTETCEKDDDTKQK